MYELTTKTNQKLGSVDNWLLYIYHPTVFRRKLQ